MIFIFMLVMLCTRMTERYVFMMQNFKELHRMISVETKRTGFTQYSIIIVNKLRMNAQTSEKEQKHFFC